MKRNRQAILGVSAPPSRPSLAAALMLAVGLSGLFLTVLVLLG